MAASNGHLHGWKDIATFLDVSVRTAQRWERVSGLPVRRLGGGRRHSVLAEEIELHAWLGAHGPEGDAGRAHGLTTSPARSAAPSAVADRHRTALRRVLVRVWKGLTRAAVIFFATR
jgi:hypothetical protein